METLLRTSTMQARCILFSLACDIVCNGSLLAIRYTEILVMSTEQMYRDGGTYICIHASTNIHTEKQTYVSIHNTFMCYCAYMHMGIYVGGVMSAAVVFVILLEQSFRMFF
jgi:hypothetical protein